MRISISNIAWDPLYDEEVSTLLQKYNIDAIDVAPGKYFPDPKQASDKDIILIRQQWELRGISLVGMQSLLFGTQGLNLFSNCDVQKKMLEHLKAVIHVASGLGIKPIVFGSPRNRDRQSLNDDEARSIAYEFFLQLGDIALKENVVICLEPNPACYGSNFMTSSYETIEMVKLLDHPAIKMQLDTGAVAINKESITQVIQGNQDVIGHIHLSEPNLAPLGRSDVIHTEISAKLNHLLPQRIATIEMLTPQGESPLVTIDDALTFVTQHYRDVIGDVS